MPDTIDLVDPIRLVILLLPPQYRGPAAVVVSTLAASQIVASLVVARLPLAARNHPRWGVVVRALHWWALVRLRDEAGSAKLPGAAVGALVAPVSRADEVDLRAATVPPPEPIAPSPMRAVTITGRAPMTADKHHAAVVAEVHRELGFDASARQPIPADAVAAAQAASTKEPTE